VQLGRTAHRYLSMGLRLPPPEGVCGPAAVNGTGQGELMAHHKAPGKKGPCLGCVWSTLAKDSLRCIGAMCRGYL